MAIFVFIVSFLINIFLLLGNNKIASLLNLYDKPDNYRKLHKIYVPLTGGIIIAVNIILFSILFIFNLDYLQNFNIFFSLQDYLLFLISLITVFLIGFFDDKFKISAIKKLIIMTVIFLLAIIYSDDLLIKEIKVSFLKNSFFLNNQISLVWTLLCFLLFVNALNMFDGINYQVAIYSVLICIFFILNNYFLIFFIILTIALIFFLILNHYNRAFLGDSGSYLLGFIFSYFFIKFYNQSNLINADQIVLFMIVPGLDLMRLFIYRIYKGKYPFTPDRNHLHHIILLKNNLVITNIKIFLLTAIPAILGFYIGLTYILLTIQILFYIYLLSNK